MSRSQGPSTLKRKRPEPDQASCFFTEHERIIYDVIKSKENMGIWIGELKREITLPATIVDKTLKSLLAKQKIKEVVNIRSKAKKHYMAAEFEPSKDISGGDWYTDGSLDTDLIHVVKDFCLRYVANTKVATQDGILDFIKSSGFLKIDLTMKQIEQVVGLLMYDNEIMEVRSTGTEEFSSIPIGRVCYKPTRKSDLTGEFRNKNFSSIPCGVCPRISQCAPDGIISPNNCVYYEKWLSF